MQRIVMNEGSRWQPTVLLLVATVGIVNFAAPRAIRGEADWTGFRGPGSSGSAEAVGLPTTWDSDTNIVWRRELPGPGGSTPIVLGDRVFLTCYSGYGESIEEPGSLADLERHVVCVDRRSGELLWSKSFPAEMPESEYRPGNDSRHGYASSTPVTDGERLYVFMGISGVRCLDLEGNQIWETNVGTRTHGWGSGTSPVIYQNLVIVNASVESKSLIALNKTTGSEMWRVEDVSGCWSSPVLVEVGEAVELVLNMPNRLRAFDPETGAALWDCDGIPDGYICPTVISHDGIVYAIGGRKNTAIAVRAGGRGDVTDSHVLWRTGKGSNVSSPVHLDGHLYWFHESRGIAYCVEAATGELVFEERLRPRPGLVYSSVTAADGKLYAVSQEEGTYVLAASPEAEVLSVNKFADDDSRTNGSIVVSHNQLLLRTDKALYCIGE